MDMSTSPINEKATIPAPNDLLDRMVRAVEKVRERLRRAAAALDGARIPYAVVGGNAVASWVARVDEAAVRNTQDVDILLNRSDLEAAKHALAEAGFVFRHVKGIDMFLDGPEPRPAMPSTSSLPARRSEPTTRSPRPGGRMNRKRRRAFRVVALESLVRMKLTSFRDKDQVHILDMIDVGLVDESWLLASSRRALGEAQGVA